MIETEQMLSSILDCRRVDLLTQDIKLTSAQEKQYQDMQQRRSAEEPLQYIIGHSDFMGIKLCVDPRVLIPRPETEILVEKAIQLLRGVEKKGDCLKILDFGTGSGNIASALVKNINNCHVTTVDVSLDALALARQNAQINKIEDKINFVHQDMCEFLIRKTEVFDLIISNPPYIKTSDLTQLPKDVQQEPRLALDGGEDGLDFYRHIIAQGHHFLKEGASLLMEIGDEQKEGIEKIFQQCLYYQKLNFYKDYVGTDRIVHAQGLL